MFVDDGVLRYVCLFVYRSLLSFYLCNLPKHQILITKVSITSVQCVGVLSRASRGTFIEGLVAVKTKCPISNTNH